MRILWVSKLCQRIDEEDAQVNPYRFQSVNFPLQIRPNLAILVLEQFEPPRHGPVYGRTPRNRRLRTSSDPEGSSDK